MGKCGYYYPSSGKSPQGGRKGGMGNESETGTLSIYAAIWLTLISGAILLKASQDFWSLASRRIRKRDPFSWLGKIPTWMNAFAAPAYIPIFLLIVIVGSKVAVASDLDRLLRLQVLLALGYLVGKIGGNFLMTADDQLRPFRPIYLLPISISTVLLIFMVYMMLNRCPNDLAQHWWMPCISLSAEPAASETLK